MTTYANMADEVDEAGYGVTVKELRELMELRKQDAINEIQGKYTDTLGLCAKLKTSTTHGTYKILSCSNTL